MAFQTKIQWCDATFNPWIGCAKVSEGCKFCYAEALMDTRYGRVQWGPNGTRSRTKTWHDPVKWNRLAQAAGERHKVFCASLADVFEDRSELVPWRADLFDLIDRCPNLDWLLLTKRPENVRRMWSGPNRGNVWLGTSISTQRNADEVIPLHLGNRGLGPVLFLSIEPQIERIDLGRFLFPRATLDWIITGGESQQGPEPARPYALEWARLLVDQCCAASIPCFVKQLGSRPIVAGGRHPVIGTFKDRHGGDWSEWPNDLRVRQCPETYTPQLVAS